MQYNDGDGLRHELFTFFPFEFYTYHENVTNRFSYRIHILMHMLYTIMSHIKMHILCQGYINHLI